MSSSCPQCHSKAFKRNGYTRNGKQNHRCLSCGKQFSLEPYCVFTQKDPDESSLAQTLSSIELYPR
jgi:transposase-like protein